MPRPRRFSCTLPTPGSYDPSPAPPRAIISSLPHPDRPRVGRLRRVRPRAPRSACRSCRRARHPLPRRRPDRGAVPEPTGSRDPSRRDSSSFPPRRSCSASPPGSRSASGAARQRHAPGCGFITWQRSASCRSPRRRRLPDRRSVADDREVPQTRSLADARRISHGGDLLTLPFWAVQYGVAFVFDAYAIWRVDSGHTAGLREHPRQYARHVLGFCDRALLGRAR